MDSFHSVDKESSVEVVHTPLREGGVFTRGRRMACQLVDVLFTEVVAARKDLEFIIMFMADGNLSLPPLYPPLFSDTDLCSKTN